MNVLYKLASRMKDGRVVVNATLESSTPKWAVYVISSGSVDRSRDRVNLRGIRTDNWKRVGAPVHVNHNFHDTYAIGNSLDPRTGEPELSLGSDGKLRAKVWFDLNDEEGRKAADKVNRRIGMGGASISFNPIKGYPNDLGGHDWDEVDLLEWSIVNVPDNADCTLEAVGKHFKGAKQAKSLDDLLAEMNASDEKLYHYARQRGIALPCLRPVKKTAVDRTLDDLLRQMRESDARLERFARARGVDLKSLGFNPQADIEGPIGSPSYDRYRWATCGCKGCLKVEKCPCSKSCQCLAAKGMETDSAGPTEETGEAALIDRGNIPPDDETQEQEVEDRTCPNCDAETKPGWKFCSECGAALEGVTDSDDPDKDEILQRYGGEMTDEETDERVDEYREPHFGR